MGSPHVHWVKAFSYRPITVAWSGCTQRGERGGHKEEPHPLALEYVSTNCTTSSHLDGVGQAAGVLHGVGCQGREVFALDQATREGSQVLGNSHVSGKLADL